MCIRDRTCLVFVVQAVLKDEGEGTVLTDQKKCDTSGDIEELDDVRGNSVPIWLRS